MTKTQLLILRHDTSDMVWRKWRLAQADQLREDVIERLGQWLERFSNPVEPVPLVPASASVATRLEIADMAGAQQAIGGLGLGVAGAQQGLGALPSWIGGCGL